MLSLVIDFSLRCLNTEHLYSIEDCLRKPFTTTKQKSFRKYFKTQIKNLVIMVILYVRYMGSNCWFQNSKSHVSNFGIKTL